MDVKHNPELRENGGFCSDCGIELPLDVVVVACGDEVIELGGAGVHWIPGFAHDGKAKACLKVKAAGTAVLVCVNCDGEGCDQCDHGIVASDGSNLQVEQAKPTGGETIETAPSKTDFEKATARMSFQNFLAMREAVKPDGE